MVALMGSVLNSNHMAISSMSLNLTEYISNVHDFITILIKQYSPARNLQSADHQLLWIPKMNLKTYGETSVSFAAPTLYTISL